MATATETHVQTPMMEPEAPEKALSRPKLLTLTGLYGGAKSIYVTYTPALAANTIESVAEKLLAVSSPYIAAIKDKAVSKESTVSEGEPTEAAHAPTHTEKDLTIAAIDQFVESLCTQADATTDHIISDTRLKLETTYTSARERVTTNVSSIKDTVVRQVEGVRPAVDARVESIKTVVHEGFTGSERVVTLRQKATDAYAVVVEYTPVAKVMITDLATTVQGEIQEKGAVGSIKVGALFLKDQLVAMVSTVREKGAVDGAKDILCSLSSTVTTAVEDAKSKVDEATSTPVAAATTTTTTTATATTEPTEEKEEQEDEGHETEEEGDEDEDEDAATESE